MTLQVELICVPLGGTSSQVGKKAIEIHITCVPTFDAGVHSQQDLDQTISAHLLFAHGEAVPIGAYFLPWKEWEARSHRFDTAAAIKGALKYKGGASFEEMRSNLRKYLGASGTPRTASKVTHDARFDHLVEDNFVNIPEAHEALESASQELRRTATMNAKGAAGTVSFRSARWLHGNVHAALLDSIYTPPPARNGLVANRIDPALTTLRKATAKIRRRLDSEAKKRFEKAVAAPAAGGKDVDPNDLNLSIHAALKNATLARALGLVTTWELDPQSLVAGDYVVRLDDAGVVVPAQTTLSVRQTAFRVGASHVHPLAFRDRGQSTTTASGWAKLNDEQNAPRYRATSVNAEAAIAKVAVVQAANSFASPANAPNVKGNVPDKTDQRPPQDLSDHQYGPAEHETSGIVFSAPVADLVTPKELVADSPEAREALYPCLFLEDLWIGYRVDLVEDAGSDFRSIHEQRQKIILKPSGIEIVGWSEDYLEREQPDDPSLGFSSTEIGTYNGLSSAQNRDYLPLIGQKRPDPVTPNLPFTVDVEDYRSVTRLLFGRIYRYRLRNVFLGVTSLSPAEDVASSERPTNEQKVPFFRARAIRAGHTVCLSSARSGKAVKEEGTIYLLEDDSESRIRLFPTPIDIETARYFGTFLFDEAEQRRHHNRVFVSDADKFFGSGTAPAPYFCDPEVSSVEIVATYLNGSEGRDADGGLFFDGNAYCHLRKHVTIGSVVARYGAEGQWEGFRPITLRIRSTEASTPSIHLHKEGGGGDSVEIHIPRAGEVEISITPNVKPAQVVRTASIVNQAPQIAGADLKKLQDGLGSQSLLTPSIAQELFQVIHTVRRPRSVPLIVGYGALPRGGRLAANRQVGSAAAEVRGRVDVDAASTGQIQLIANWKDVDDSPSDKYSLNAVSSLSKPKSINFSRYRAPAPSASVYVAYLARESISPQSVSIGTASYSLADQFELQCAEDKVFLGVAPVPDEKNLPSPGAGTVNFFDQRRKYATVQALGIGRYASKYATAVAKGTETSLPAIVDVPSTVRMSSPSISHVLPLLADKTSMRSGALIEESFYGVRIYVRRPWFESGVGERLAIGCRTGGDLPTGLTTLDKSVSQWGEDPIERPGVEASKRLPRASDFLAADNIERQQEWRTDLYPGIAGVDDAAVMYRDNVRLPKTEGRADDLYLSIASFALHYDVQEKLWYCDVMLSSDFKGWCGLALYRHQPHALEGFSLSENVEWAYAGFLQGQSAAWVANGNEYHLTIGPVYDPYTSYALLPARFHEGISENIAKSAPEMKNLRRYKVGRAYYFEGYVSKEMFHWSLMKMRFGKPVASFPFAFMKEKG